MLVNVVLHAPAHVRVVCEDLVAELRAIHGVALRVELEVPLDGLRQGGTNMYCNQKTGVHQNVGARVFYNNKNSRHSAVPPHGPHLRGASLCALVRAAPRGWVQETGPQQSAGRSTRLALVRDVGLHEHDRVHEEAPRERTAQLVRRGVLALGALVGLRRPCGTRRVGRGGGPSLYYK